MQPKEQIKIFYHSQKVSEHLRNWKTNFFKKNAEPESLITVTWWREEHRTLALDVSASSTRCFSQ